MLGIEGIDPRVYLHRLRDPLHKNAMLLTLNSIVPSFWGLGFWLIVVRVYPAREVGVATAIFPTAGLIAALATLGFAIGLVRFLPAEGRRARDIINSALSLSALLSLAGGLAFVLGARFWAQDLGASIPGKVDDFAKALELVGGDPLFGAAFILFTVAAVGSLLVDSALIAQSRAEYVFFKTNAFGVFRIPLPILLFLAGTVGSLAIFISFSLAVFLAFALGLFYFLPKVYLGYRFRPSFHRRSLAPMMRFSLANHPANMVALIPGALIPLMILKWMSAENQAYYFAAWLGASVVFSVSISASTSLLAEGSRREATLDRNTRKAWAFILALQVPAVVITLVLADLLLNFFQQGYSAGGTALRLFALSSFFLAYNNIYLTRKRIEKNNRAILAVVVLQGALNLLLAAVLILPWGLTGVGAAFLVSQGVTAGAIAIWGAASSPAGAKILLGEGPGEELGKGVKPD